MLDTLTGEGMKEFVIRNSLSVIRYLSDTVK